jgi:hypothetical protein
MQKPNRSVVLCKLFQVQEFLAHPAKLAADSVTVKLKESFRANSIYFADWRCPMVDLRHVLNHDRVELPGLQAS